MRWLLAMPTIGAFALILAVEIRANAEPVEVAQAPTDVRTLPLEESEASKRAATALVRPASGSDVMGLVRFWETSDGKVAYDLELYGLEPGRHGFHVHEHGDCSAPDATSAGGHFNPEGAPHGAPTDRRRHVGDLGNIRADEHGHVVVRGIDEHIRLRGAHNIVGRAVVVHAKADDLRSQPAGDAGARIGCGIIRLLPPASSEDAPRDRD